VPFKELEMQEGVVSFLRSAIHQNRLPHALIFSGPPGSGQAEMAVALTQALFCREQKKGEACGVCSDCHLAEERNHPDLVWLEPEEDSSTIKVEQIRALISRSNLMPLQALSKVFVIEPADALNDTGQNALLKTLEEPEGSATLILITHAMEKLLPTVRSRAQLLNFIPTLEEGKIKASLADARAAVFTYCLAVSPDSGAAPDLGGLQREDVLWVLEAVIGDLREALLIGAGAASILGAIDQRPRKESAAEALGTDLLIERLEMLADFKDKIAHSVNTKLALAALWEKL
jgi:DNA polymerase-3 subunit delta'